MPSFETERLFLRPSFEKERRYLITSFEKASYFLIRSLQKKRNVFLCICPENRGDVLGSPGELHILV